MSTLTGHAKAAHILGDAFEIQAGQQNDTNRGLLLMAFATAYRIAARDMEQAMRAECSGVEI